MKYFTELKLSGYKSIQDVTVKLNPGINIFIGPNGSGKSNLLEFISYLKDEIPELDTNYSISSIWKVGPETFRKQISKNVSLDEESLEKDLKAGIRPEKFLAYTHKYSFWHNNKEIVIDEPVYDFDRLAGLLENYEDDLLDSITYITFVEGGLSYEYLTNPSSITLSVFDALKVINSQIPFSYLVGLPAFLLRRNSMVDSELLSQFKTHFKSTLRRYLQLIKRYSPITDINLKDIIKVGQKEHQAKTVNNIQFIFKLNNNWHTWDELSDGTRRLLSIIYFVHKSSGVVLLEEPELGIHPHQLSLLLQFLKEESIEKQIILTTHSPDVLNILNPKDLDNINIVSNKKGITRVKKLSSKQKQAAEYYFEETGTIGDYWKYSDLEI